MRRREMDGDALIDRDALGVDEGQVSGVARREPSAADRVDDWAQVAARRPHDADGAAPGCRGDGDDRIVVARQHAAILTDAPCASRRLAPSIAPRWCSRDDAMTNGAGGGRGGKTSAVRGTPEPAWRTRHPKAGCL